MPENTESDARDSIDDGGLAKDMTLRDYFAAEAMKGCMANSEMMRLCDEVAEEKGWTLAEGVIVTARIYADAWIAQKRYSEKQRREGGEG